MKTHDSLGRRLRHADIPDDKQFEYSDKDVPWYELIHHHGILPTSFLYEFTKDERKNKPSVQRRLRGLTYNLKTLTRLKNKIRSDNPWADEAVYDLTPESKAILRGRNLWRENAPELQPPFEHMLMCSSVTASFHLNCKYTEGFEYIPQADMISSLRYKLDAGLLIPDHLFGIRTQGKTLAIFLECDRSTEPKHKLHKKLDLYSELFNKNKHGVEADAYMLFFVTTTEYNRRKFLDLISERYKNGYARIGTHVIPSFGVEYRIPRPMDMLSVEWHRAGYGAFKLR